MPACFSSALLTALALPASLSFADAERAQQAFEATGGTGRVADAADRI
jgi:hypothetical protein